MNDWIALLRGINVGGNRILPMKDLRVLLSELGCEDVQTYIQSGNCLFQHKETDARNLSALIGRRINSKFGFEPKVFCLTQTEIREVLEQNPFEVSEEDGNRVLIYFLDAQPALENWNSLAELKANSEQLALTQKAAYLYAPNGVSRSKVAERAEAKLKVGATARNLRTVKKLVRLSHA